MKMGEKEEDNLLAEDDRNNECEDESSNNSDERTSDTTSSKSAYGEDEKKLLKKKKDLLHRDIEKRRRERINKSLLRLKELVPATKNSIKCDGVGTGGRLQKAKLLEMTVDYLSSLPQHNGKETNETLETKPEKITKNPSTDTVIAASAKEIYLTGYKAAQSHVLSKLQQTFMIPAEQMKELMKSINQSEVKMPDIMLRPQNSPEKTKKKDADSSSTFKGKTNHSSEISMNKSLYDTNETFGKEDYSSPSLSPRSLTSSENETQPNVLMSCMIKDPSTQTYYPSLLPLQSLISESNKQASYSHIYKASLKALEALDDSKARQETLQNRFDDTSPPRNKRRFSEERQVPVIRSSMDNIPNRYESLNNQFHHEQYHYQQSNLMSPFYNHHIDKCLTPEYSYEKRKHQSNHSDGFC